MRGWRPILIALILGGAGTAWWMSGSEARRLQAENDQLKAERDRLEDYAKRLAASRRVAQLTVTGQSRGDDGKTRTRLLWQEIGDADVRGAPHEIEVTGSQVYIEALVLKFDLRLVAEGDAARGTSLAMFRRAFGDEQASETGPDLDRARPPRLLEHPDAAAAATAAELWGKFWQLVDDPAQARRLGVRIAQCEAPSALMKPGQVWEVCLDAAGGLNLRKIAEER